MDWQVAIDIKLWGDRNCLPLIDLLSYAKGRNWLSVMFSGRLYPMMSPNVSWLINSTLQQVERSPYESKPQGTTITLQPDLTVGLGCDEIMETEGVAFIFLQTAEPPHKVYTLTADRNSTGAKQLLIQDGSSKTVSLLTFNDSNSLEQFFSAHKPKLEQAKHIAQQERTIGGEIASKFSAWDSRHPEYAESLLEKAFDDSGASQIPPGELFVWDAQNETYVRFMHSGNWEYHGHDFADYNRIPDEVKKRYNHWKK